MASQAAVERLPTFVALEALSVLAGERPGASVPFDATYFDGVSRATQATPDETSAVEPDTRLQQVQRSRLALNTTSVALDAFEREEVLAASENLRETAEQLPEVEFLRAAFPGEVVVVPEWLRTGRMADWGLRAYFFREGDAPAPDEIVERNVETEVEGNRSAFERYQGDLHGYPECCIEAFHDRAQDRPDPEWRSVESLADEFRDEALQQGQNVSIDDLLPDFFESERALAFFAREFFPEPDCETARATGEQVYDALREEVGEALARDYVALNYAFCYAVARTLREGPSGQGGRGRPSAGDLGMEHFSFYAPLSHVRTFPRYE